MSSEKARFFFHVYFHYENKEKHVRNAKFSNDAILCPPRALPSVLWRDDILRKIHCNYLVSVHKVGYYVCYYKFKEL
jgi:hypothetical protein